MTAGTIREIMACAKRLIKNINIKRRNK